jgi:hypothetical protein
MLRRRGDNRLREVVCLPCLVERRLAIDEGEHADNVNRQVAALKYGFLHESGGSSFSLFRAALL